MILSRGIELQEVPVNPSSQQEGVYEELDVSQPYDEIHSLPQSNTSHSPENLEYDYIPTSTPQAAVSSHGDNSKEFGYTDCAAYNVLSN